MSDPRFFVSNLPEAGEVELSLHESKHAVNVLRLRTGDRVILFDGRGGEAVARVASLGARHTCISIEARTDTSRELPFELELLVALPKGDRQRILVEGLTQLGVSRLIPLSTERSVAKPTGKTLERLARFVLESSKQCGRNVLMEIAGPLVLADLLAGTADPPPACLFAHPYGVSNDLADLQPAIRASRSIRLAIGPEGGFTPDEAAQLVAAHWLQVSLGPRILRVEFAAVSLTASITALNAVHW